MKRINPIKMKQNTLEAVIVMLLGLIIFIIIIARY